MSNIKLSTVGYIDLLNPSEQDIHIEDIAYGLSNICRFTGNTSTFYSIAQHSAIVASVVPKHLRLQTLLHYASKAFLGDISTPWKALLLENRRMEKTMEDAIFKRFNLPPFKAGSIIKAADMLVMHTIKRDLMIDHDAEASHFSPSPMNTTAIVKIVPLPPIEAKKLFLMRFNIYSRWNSVNVAGPHNIVA